MRLHGMELQVTRVAICNYHAAQRRPLGTCLPQEWYPPHTPLCTHQLALAASHSIPTPRTALTSPVAGNSPYPRTRDAAFTAASGNCLRRCSCLQNLVHHLAARLLPCYQPRPPPCSPNCCSGVHDVLLLLLLTNSPAARSLSLIHI